MFLNSKNINHWNFDQIEQNNKRKNKDNISDEGD